jgi:hypothetical protein
MKFYFPEITKSSDIIGNSKFKLDFVSYIKNEMIQDYKKRNNLVILIIGDSAIGRTTLVKILLKELGYELIDIEENIMSLNSKQIIEGIQNSLLYRDINSFFCKNKKRALLLDDIETIISTNKNFLSFLINAKNPSKIPIIGICNRLYDTKIAELKKYSRSKIFYMNKPNVNEVNNLFIKILDDERNNKIFLDYKKRNIIDDTYMKYKKLVLEHKLKVKTILENLDSLFIVCNNKNKQKREIEDFDDINDNTLYDMANDIFKNRYKIKDMDKILYTENGYLDIILHENFPIIMKKIPVYGQNIEKKSPNFIKLAKAILKILDGFCEGDIMEDYRYGLMSNISSLMKYVSLNEILTKKKVLVGANYNIYNKLSFASQLSKLNMRTTYYKRCKIINDIYRLPVNNSYIYFIEILNIIYKQIIWNIVKNKEKKIELKEKNEIIDILIKYLAIDYKIDKNVSLIKCITKMK